MQEDFYVALFSNSSFDYFPENKSTYFTTKLPRHINLHGRWTDALFDIHIPLNFQNVSKEEEDGNRHVTYDRTGDREIVETFYVAPGIYRDLVDLLRELNKISAESHLELVLKPGFYIGVRKSCEKCNYVKHKFDMSAALKKILSFLPDRKLPDETLSDEIQSDSPANLNANLPENFFIYTDICQPYITGDIYSKLLRNVALDLDHYAYGRPSFKSFLRPVYVPLSTTSFETIEILIRDETGAKVPIDHGTLTLTLHFRRLS